MRWAKALGKPVANKLRAMTAAPKKPSVHPHKNLGKYLHKAKKR